MSYYKELSRLSKKVADGLKNDGTYYQAGIAIDSLCAAIETLLAERDEAVAYLHGDCVKCVYADTDENENPCAECLVNHPENGDYRDYWKWRGIVGGNDGKE